MRLELTLHESLTRRANQLGHRIFKFFRSSLNSTWPTYIQNSSINKFDYEVLRCVHMYVMYQRCTRLANIVLNPKIVFNYKKPPSGLFIGIVFAVNMLVTTLLTTQRLSWRVSLHRSTHLFANLGGLEKTGGWSEDRTRAKHRAKQRRFHCTTSSYLHSAL